MEWSASRVRRRLQIPAGEELVAWARAEAEGMQVPAAATGPVRRWAPQVALTGDALWVSRSGATARFGLERVVMASLVDRPDGALRVDFLAGDPLVVLVRDGGTFVHCLGREIHAFDRRLQRRVVEIPWDRTGPTAVRRSGHPTTSWGTRGPVGTDASSGDASRALLHEAELIVLRELRTVLTETGTP